jgi:predicted aspartyl protease
MKSRPDRPLFLFVALLAIAWAASMAEAAHLNAANGATGQAAPKHKTIIPATSSSIRARLPDSISFREVKGRGLLAKAWINGAGPYTFAIDTGAGITLIAERVAEQANVSSEQNSISLAGLSGVRENRGREATIRTLALGDADNLLPGNRRVAITNGLPADIDGILDPTDAYSPFGYSIDLPGHRIEAFDPKVSPLSPNPSRGGTVVRWLSNGTGRRPFVRLSDGRLALIDTGSGFGLAISEDSAIADRRNGRSEVRDVGGGSVTAKRVEPSTVSIGAMTLRNIPTDIVYGVEKGAPVLLGRDALDPFRITFDPMQRLIAIVPAQH